jgi:general secretion pathway protein G
VSRGFTIIEVLVIIVIIGVIAAVVAPRLINRIGQAKTSVAANNASSIASAVSLYEADCGVPESGTSLTILLEKPGNADGWKGPYLRNAEELIDPWGHPFILEIPGKKNTSDFDVVSYGADGQPGGTGDNEDIRKP